MAAPLRNLLPQSHSTVPKCGFPRITMGGAMLSTWHPGGRGGCFVALDSTRQGRLTLSQRRDQINHSQRQCICLRCFALTRLSALRICLLMLLRFAQFRPSHLVGPFSEKLRSFPIYSTHLGPYPTSPIAFSLQVSLLL